MSLIIREATGSDLFKIIELYATSLEDSLIPLSESLSDVLRKINFYPYYKIYVAEEDATIIGVFSLLIMDNLAHQGASSGIIDIFAIDLKSDYFITKKCILDFVMDICLRNGCYKLVLPESHRALEKEEAFELQPHGFCFVMNLKKEELKHELKPFFGRILSDLEIREATVDDLSSILMLYAQPEMDNGQVLDPSAAIEKFEKVKTYPNYKIYVALFESEIVGTFALLLSDNLMCHLNPVGIIEDVAVSPKAQGKGVGKFMMNFAIAHCMESNCSKLVLSSSHKRVIAHNFYKSLGFEQIGKSFIVPIEPLVKDEIYGAPMRN